MGGINSKLRKCLEMGDEEMATKLMEEHSDMLKNFGANEVITEYNETPLLLCCKWSMTPIVQILLKEFNGNPNRKNVFNQTALHLVCQIPLPLQTDTTESIDETPQPTLEEVDEKRALCMKLLLRWNKMCPTNRTKKVTENIDVNALDRYGNTALHLAAHYGLLKCVKILMENNSELFVENESGDTACELAAKYCHFDVLRYLEFKMVYSNRFNALLSKNTEYSLKEIYSPMELEDLEEAKNRLIAETSNMLNVSLSYAEVLLRSFDWSQESLIDYWFNESNGNQLTYKFNETIESQNFNQDVSEANSQQSVNLLCEICSLELNPKASIGAKCGHQFCYDCWRTYLELKIEIGETSAISCPAFNCSYLVTMEIIGRVVSSEMNSKFLRNDIEVFVESNPYINWCPFPTCNKAVHLPESHLHANDEQSYILSNMPPILPVSHAVACGSGHEFCWQCKRDSHSPCDCKLWEDWMIKISDIKAEELKQTYSRTEDAANCLWLVRNAKQCPRCKTHIQKSEGCNHLRCSKCKFDFCWVCLESWKKHNSGTGGYFRCNRSEAAQRAEQNICLLKRVAETHNCEMKELKKFVFHYTKYKFNYMTGVGETSLIDRSKTKQKELFGYSQELLKSGEKEVKISESDDFFYTATLEMIRARRVLCGSAVYGYYLEDHGYNKAVFEYMENNLNFICNRLADIIGFDFLKNTRNYIIDLTRKLKNKRLEFLSAIAKGLIPPETPPGLKKHHKRHCLPGVLALDSMENLCNPCDENDNSLMNAAIISSLSEYSDKTLWIQDKTGRHNNLFAIYDWPDDCHVDYCDCGTDPIDDNLCAQTSSENELEICSNLLCTKPKVKNPRTGKKHDFCSLKCKFLSEERNTLDDDFEVDYKYDPSMDLLLAIEMSKLSYEEEKQRHIDTESLHSNSIMNEEDNEEDSTQDFCENTFEQFIKDIKINPNSNESSTKTAVMFFLKSSFNERIDDKNLNQTLNDMKVTKQLFSSN